MKLLTALRDPRNENYSLYHTAVLFFVVTTGIPMNIGMVRLPFFESLLLFLGGFFSLFMLARSTDVGNAFLSHLKVKHTQQKITIETKKIQNTTLEQNPKHDLEKFKSNLASIERIPDNTLISLSALKTAIGIKIISQKNIDPTTESELHTLYKKISKMIEMQEK